MHNKNQTSSFKLIILTAIITSIITSAFIPLQKRIESKYQTEQLNMASLALYWQQRADTIKEFGKYARGLDVCLDHPDIDTEEEWEIQFTFCYNNYYVPLVGLLSEIKLRFGSSAYDQSVEMHQTLDLYIQNHTSGNENLRDIRSNYIKNVEEMESLLIDNINIPHKSLPINTDL